jgi:hypothetical protein
VRALRQVGGPVFLLDAGGSLVRDEGAVAVPGLPRTRAAFMAEGMARIGYDAGNLGGRDRELGGGELERIVRGSGVRWISANLDVPSAQPPWSATIILGAEGSRLGVVGIDAPAGLPGGSGPMDPLEVARGEAARLRREGCRVVVLLLAAGEDGVLATLAGDAAATGLFDVIVLAGGDAPTAAVSPGGRALVVATGGKGSHLGLLDLRIAPGGEAGWHALGDEGGTPPGGRRYRWEAVPLDDSVRPDPEMAALLERYREEVSRLTPAASAEGPSFVGANRCASCHPAEFREWLTTSHAQGYAVLALRGADRNPECLPCHVTGYGRPGGFQGHRATPHLEGVQCESCHGPGAGHPPGKASPAPPDEGTCRRCHDTGNSPDFSYDGYVESLGGHVGGRAQ